MTQPSTSTRRQFGGIEVERGSKDETKMQFVMRHIKISLIGLWWLGIFVLIVLHAEQTDNPRFVAVTANRPQDVALQQEIPHSKVRVQLEGPFALEKFENGIDVLNIPNIHEIYLQIQWLQMENGVEVRRTNLSKLWIIKLSHKEDLNDVDTIERTKVLKLEIPSGVKSSDIFIHLSTNMDSSIPLTIQCDMVAKSDHLGFIMGFILIIVYWVLIVFDLVPRTFAAMLVCTMAIGILGALSSRPSFPQILEWMNMGMFMVQFGISIIVTLVLRSGIYGWLGVRAFKVSRGHVWPFLYIMIAITYAMSVIFETTMVVIILGPLVLLMCQLMAINAIPVVIILTCFAQIGEIALPYSSLLNHRVTNQPFLVEKDITARAYVAQGVPFCLLIFITTFAYFRLVFRDSTKIGLQQTEADALKRIIDVLDDTAAAIAGYTKDEQAVRTRVKQKAERLEIRLKRLGKMPQPIEKFEEKLARYYDKMGIRNKFILLASILPMVFIVFMTFVNFFKNHEPMAIGWTVILSALLFMIIVGENDFEELLYHVDWTTFIFLACRFVLTCALDAMWIDESIGVATKYLIYNFGTSRTWMAPITVYIIASISSCLLDNVAVANTMIRVVSLLSLDEDLHLKLKPLIYALTFGLHIGAMGTQISSMVSIIFSGLVQRHALSYPFYSHFKYCFPLMLINSFVSIIYIIFIHYLAELY